MEKIISYPLSVLYYLAFGLLLVAFHPIQWICFNVFGYRAHQRSVELLNFLIGAALLIFTGNSIRFYGVSKIPKGKPIIFVANHQSMYDIVAIVWNLRAFHPKFVSKKELGKWIPSVSYNLRVGGSILIDRKDPKQALPVIKGLSEYIQAHKRSAVIFPEGTRSKTGQPGEFAPSGLKILCKYAPDAVVVPLTINNSHKVVKYGFFPAGLGNRLTFTIHNPLPVKDYTFDELFAKTEKSIVDAIKN